MNHPASAACLPLLLAACASAPPVPAAIEPGADEALVLTVAAAGVQIYECRNAATSGGAPQWVFTAPEAQLFDGQRRPIGSHGAGPHWLADDGSRLQGSVKARADAPSAGAIPWLLLTTTASGPDGRFGGVTSIQRVNTVGGVAPAGPCTPGATARTPYSADYRFFRSAR